MAIFKYTVVNKEGKKLSGSVEALSENIARSELNNLGFSILMLEQVTDIQHAKSETPKFVFEAIDKNSQPISGTIPANNEEEAYEKLRNEYGLTITSIWDEKATPSEINLAKQVWSKRLQTQLREIEFDSEVSKTKSLEQKREEEFVKRKIDNILKDVHQLLIKFDQEFDGDQKAEISKRINKILRIKNSTNLSYILSTAEDLLTFIQDQEKAMREKGYQDKRVDLEIETRKLLNELKKDSKPKTLAEDIINKITDWEKSYYSSEKKQKNPINNFIAKLFKKIKRKLNSSPAIIAIKEQIRAYDKQLFELVKLFFKEATPDYREKILASIKGVWLSRKKAKRSLKQARIILKQERSELIRELNEEFSKSFVKELNTFSGFILGFYLTFYFISLILSQSYLGFKNVPQIFFYYESTVFKYALSMVFLLHATTAIKTNFLEKSFIANLTLPLVFLLGSIFIFLNN